MSASSATLPTPTFARSTGLLTRGEAAALLRISLNGLDKLCHRHEDPLPLLCAGRRFLFNPETVLRWCERQGKKKQREITTR